MLGNLALVVASVLLTLLAFEVGVRLGIVPLTEFVVSDAWWKEHWFRERRGGNPRHFVALDPDLGWVPAADLRDEEYQGVLINTNAAHMRGRREIPLERGGALRIAAVGDSYTFGQCAGDDETFPAAIEEALPGSEVLNLGVMGYGQDQALLRMRRDALPYRPDFVVFGFHGTDMRRNTLTFRDYGKPRLRMEADGGLVLENVPVPTPDHYDGQLWPPRIWNYAVMLRDSIRYRQPEWQSHIHELSEAIVHRMAEEAEAGGAQLVVVLLPTVWNVKAEGAFGGWPWFQKLCAGGGFLCADPVPRFRALLPDDEAMREHFDCHYSPLLYRAVGEATADVIREASSAVPEESVATNQEGPS